MKTMAESWRLEIGGHLRCSITSVCCSPYPLWNLLSSTYPRLAVAWHRCNAYWMELALNGEDRGSVQRHGDSSMLPNLEIEDQHKLK